LFYRSAEDAYSSVAPDPTFAFVGNPCWPILGFVIAFWIMITFYTLLTSLFCIQTKPYTQSEDDLDHSSFGCALWPRKPYRQETTKCQLLFGVRISSIQTKPLNHSMSRDYSSSGCIPRSCRDYFIWLSLYHGYNVYYTVNSLNPRKRPKMFSFIRVEITRDDLASSRFRQWRRVFV
jgi:hypothetical protein